MRVGIIGSGTVGQTLGAKLASLGHEVKIGTRDPGKLRDWLAKAGQNASVGSNADAAAFGEIVLHCTAGAGSLEALGAAGADNLGEKVLVDVSNPLDFSRGLPPSLLVCNTDSLGEQIQRAFPRARVVKALNTVTASVMVEPTLVPGESDLFICGDDPAAKAEVSRLLGEWFGWRSAIDLGDISNARAMEMYLPLWVRLFGTLGTPHFNVKVVR